jgi:hypothetical protein
VIDGATDSVVATIGVGAEPNALAWNPARNRVYVANHASSSISVLRDSGGGIEESFKPQAPSSKPMPTIVRGVLFLPEASSHEFQAASLLDIAGRWVMDLRPGVNDVRALAPGIYFVRSAACGERSAVARKVIVTR